MVVVVLGGMLLESWGNVDHGTENNQSSFPVRRRVVVVAVQGRSLGFRRLGIGAILFGIWVTRLLVGAC